MAVRLRLHAHPPFTDHMLGHPFFYDSDTPDETRRLLGRLGCRLLVAGFANRPTGGRDKARCPSKPSCVR